MGMEYGRITLGGNSLKQQITDANRDYNARKMWQGLFGGLDLTKQQQTATLKKDYAEALAGAYSSAYKADLNIADSNLGQGYKAAAMNDVDAALEQAYETYRNNYLTGKSKIDTTYDTAVTQVNDALTTQAEYIKRYGEVPYEYLQYLFNAYNEGKDEDNIFLNNPVWSRYVYDEEIENESGEIEKTGNKLLKSWENIVKDENLFKLNDEGKQELTIKGADFYDQMFNYEATMEKYPDRTFGNWLFGNDEDLYNWSMSYNPYDYKPDKFGVNSMNKNSFNTMVGLTADDELYSFAERYGGLNEGELNKLFESYVNKANELSTKINESQGRDSRDIVNSYKDLSTDIQKLVDDLGIQEDIESALDMSFEQFTNNIVDAASDTVRNGDIWGENITKVILETAIGGATGFLFYGPTGALVGSIVALIGGTIEAVNASNKTLDSNKAIAKQVKTYYDNMLTELVNYTQNQRRQKEIDFYNKNK